MDINAERQLIERLKPVIGTSTLVVITHKATLLELVDRVIVLDQGKVVADGPRDKVLGAGSGPASGALRRLPRVKEALVPRALQVRISRRGERAVMRPRLRLLRRRPQPRPRQVQPSVAHYRLGRSVPSPLEAVRSRWWCRLRR